MGFINNPFRIQRNKISHHPSTSQAKSPSVSHTLRLFIIPSTLFLIIEFSPRYPSSTPLNGTLSSHDSIHRLHPRSLHSRIS
ncbi:hypothetical protein B0O99DRAFT_631618 [Bisporella sp. PMI_857]|nr:hypothetical protein B0O99DRAFT_631618 [Bisporella sp. PMI_857]